MSKRSGSQRKHDAVLKAVIIIAAASVILACVTIAIFLGLGKKAAPEQTADTEETEIYESDSETVREVVSLEMPGGITEDAPENTDAANYDTTLQAEEDPAAEAGEETDVTAIDTADAEETAESEDASDKDLSEDENKSENSEEDKSKTEDENKPEDENSKEPETQADPEDKSAPCFLSFTNTPIIKAGDTFDIHKFIGYADDTDRDVQIAINGEVDVNTVGKYPLEIVLADDAGHVASRNMEVNVVAEMPPSVPSETKSEAFSDFIAAYKTEQTSVGIDISRWQETVDFAKVKAAGCEFVYIRIGGLDDGELYTDRYYLNNIAGAKANGLKVGIYWHAEENSAEQVKSSVAYLLNVLGGEQLDLPVAYDWEDFKNFENYGMNLKDINNNASVFASELSKAGYSACLYSSKFFLENVWSSAGTPVWLAHYTKATSYPGQYFMWQHSCTGKIDGIAGAVDLDVLYNANL